MRTILYFLRSRAGFWLGLAALGLSQTGCAHTVWVEPSVVVQARVGGPVYGNVYGAVYSPSPWVVAPPPVWMTPAPVAMPPRVIMYAPAPIYRFRHRGERHGLHHGHGAGRGHRDGR